MNQLVLQIAPSHDDEGDGDVLHLRMNLIQSHFIHQHPRIRHVTLEEIPEMRLEKCSIRSLVVCFYLRFFNVEAPRRTEFLIGLRERGGGEVRGEMCEKGSEREEGERRMK